MALKFDGERAACKCDVACKLRKIRTQIAVRTKVKSSKTLAMIVAAIGAGGPKTHFAVSCPLLMVSRLQSLGDRIGRQIT